MILHSKKSFASESDCLCSSFPLSFQSDISHMTPFSHHFSNCIGQNTKSASKCKNFAKMWEIRGFCQSTFGRLNTSIYMCREFGCAPACVIGSPARRDQRLEWRVESRVPAGPGGEVVVCAACGYFRFNRRKDTDMLKAHECRGSIRLQSLLYHRVSTMQAATGTRSFFVRPGQLGAYFVFGISDLVRGGCAEPF